MADWYLRSNGADEFNSNSYTFVGSTAPACPGNGYVFVVLAEDSGTGKPILTPAIMQEIQNAINTQTDQFTVLLRSQP